MESGSEIFPTVKEILDYYHCSEYIHDLANEQYGKGTKNAVKGGVKVRRVAVENCDTWFIK